jgi:NADH-quinone oxidoreductase subunit J
LLALLSFVVLRLFPNSRAVHFGAFTNGTAKDVGQALFTRYLLPFEVTSILILIAIVGAVVLALKEMD